MYENKIIISYSADPNYDFSSTEKIVELYERLLKEKDEVIEMYKKQQKAS